MASKKTVDKSPEAQALEFVSGMYRKDSKIAPQVLQQFYLWKLAAAKAELPATDHESYDAEDRKRLPFNGHAPSTPEEQNQKDLKGEPPFPYLTWKEYENGEDPLYDQYSTNEPSYNDGIGRPESATVILKELLAKIESNAGLQEQAVAALTETIEGN